MIELVFKITIIQFPCANYHFMGKFKLDFKGLEFEVAQEKITRACLGSDIGEFIVIPFLTSYLSILSKYVLLVSKSTANKAVM